jgi:hypothetical protein
MAAAKVTVQPVGAALSQREAHDIRDLKSQLGLSSYQATVNGEPVDDDYELSDYEFVSLAPKVKGARFPSFAAKLRYLA